MTGKGQGRRKLREVVLSQLMIREWIRMCALAVEFLLGQAIIAIGFGGCEIFLTLLTFVSRERGGCH